MYAIEVGSETPMSLSIQVMSERHIARTNKQRFCHGMGSGLAKVLGQPQLPDL